MITREGSRLHVEGSVTVDNVKGILAQGLAEIVSGAVEVDLSRLDQSDSSMIGMMLEWKRKKPDLVFSGVKPDLASLARLYGLSGLFPGT
jgi:ABC-type transporter Mla MlaB component